MFKKLALTSLVATLFTTTLLAQETSITKPYYTRAPCTPFQVAANLMADYNETILLTGNLLTFPAQSEEPAMGRLVFSTNQDTGTYSIIQLFPDGMACLIGSGFAFEPYVD
jgi:hypothetical protein|tara:strand:+ start:888 stop:1220 length:333 start_codon:yes stop_codon:yes gene_type:complete